MRDKRITAVLVRALVAFAIVGISQAGHAAPAGTDFDLSAHLRQGVERMSADEVAAAAVETAPSLSSARVAARKASEAAARAFQAVYPRVDVTGRYSRIDPGDNTKVPFEIVFDPAIPGIPERIPADADFSVTDEQYGVRAEVLYPVTDLFLTVMPTYRAADGFAEAEKHRVDAERSAVALSAREAYYRYVLARASLAVAEAGVAQARGHQTDVAALVDAGEVARVDLLRAEAASASAEVARTRADTATSVAARALATILHRELRGSVAIDDDLTRSLDAPRGGEEELFAEAVERRPEVLALRKVIGAHEDSAMAAAGRRYPSLSLGASIDYSKPPAQLFALDESADKSWTAGAVVTWSPNELLAANSDKRQADADRAKAEADLLGLVDAIRLEVAEAYGGYLGARAAMGSARVAIRAAEEAYRVRREQFRLAAAVASDVVTAQSELQRARLELVDAAIEARVARARLSRAIAE